MIDAVVRNYILPIAGCLGVAAIYWLSGRQAQNARPDVPRIRRAPRWVHRLCGVQYEVNALNLPATIMQLGAIVAGVVGPVSVVLLGADSYSYRLAVTALFLGTLGASLLALLWILAAAKLMRK